MEESRPNYLFGMRPVIEAVRSGKEIEKILFRQGLEGELFRELNSLAFEAGIPVQYVPVEKLNSITRGIHQGVIAYIAKIDFIPLEEMVEKALSKRANPVFIMLDGVTDVRNFGGIARTAECAGVDGIILPAKGGASINADAIKTSAGALLRVNSCRVQNLRVAIFYLRECGFQIVAATEKAETTIYEVNFKKPTAIIMGSEGKGVSDSTLELCDIGAKIPMAGEIGSLNVSIATAVILFESLRQRMK